MSGKAIEKGEKPATVAGNDTAEGNPIVARGGCGKCGETLFQIQIHLCGCPRLVCEACREVWEPPGWYRHGYVVPEKEGVEG
jgi:hypothetical protein